MTEPTLNDFANAANDLYAEPTEQHFYAVCNMARDLLALSSRKWDEGYNFARSAQDAEVSKLRDLTDEMFGVMIAALFLTPHDCGAYELLDEATKRIRPKWDRRAREGV